MSQLNEQQQKDCNESKWDFSDLKALFLNCTLKKSPEKSNTAGLMNISRAIMDANNVHTELLRPVDYPVAYGVYPDMTEHGWDTDAWPEIQKKVMNADILVIGSPIWLGDKSSICKMVIERLDGSSSKVNDNGQYAYYNKVAGCVVTGNEDGAKHCSMGIMYSLQHIGYTIPPQSDAAWLGEAGPGPSYLDENSGGPENDFTNRNITFMSWNLMHFARMLKDQNGIPAHGNVKEEWDAGCEVSFPNPEYR